MQFPPLCRCPAAATSADGRAFYSIYSFYSLYSFYRIYSIYSIYSYNITSIVVFCTCMPML